MAPARKYKDLEARLGYQFRSRDLLKKALTHASVRQAPGKRRDNERLEFLGDRVLGLAIAELLWEAYPAADEGELARLYNRLIRGRTCAAVARGSPSWCSRGNRNPSPSTTIASSLASTCS